MDLFKRNGNTIDSVCTSIISVSKIFAICAGPTGLLVLLTYLQSVRAPLPISDFSSAPTLVTIAGIYSVIVTLITFFLLLPAFACSVSSETRDSTRIRSLSYLPQFKRYFGNINREMLLFQSSALIAILVFCSLQLLITSVLVLVVFILCTCLIASALSVSLFYNGGRLFSIYAWKFRAAAISKLYFGCVARSLFCSLWLMILEFTISQVKIITDIPGGLINRIITWIGFYFVATIIYLTLTSVRTRTQSISKRIFLFIAIIILVALFSGSAFSKKTLHFMGIGGGIPVEILYRTVAVGGKGAIAQKITGCLILNAGSRVIIQPMTNPTESTCSRMLSTQELRYGTMYRGITVFSGSDTIELSGFIPE